MNIDLLNTYPWYAKSPADQRLELFLLDRRVAARNAVTGCFSRIRLSTGWEENAGVRIEFTLDCCDLERTAAFWRTALGFHVEGEINGRYLALSGQGVTLTLQKVPERKSGKNRMHLDLLVEDLLQEVHRLEQLGATRLTPVQRHEFDQTWFVLADPDGNEFCVAQA